MILTSVYRPLILLRLENLLSSSSILRRGFQIITALLKVLVLLRRRKLRESNYHLIILSLTLYLVEILKVLRVSMQVDSLLNLNPHPLLRLKS